MGVGLAQHGAVDRLDLRPPPGRHVLNHRALGILDGREQLVDVGDPLLGIDLVTDGIDTSTTSRAVSATSDRISGSVTIGPQVMSSSAGAGSVDAPTTSFFHISVPISVVAPVGKSAARSTSAICSEASRFSPW